MRAVATATPATPANGGQRITAAQLQPGDLILSSANGMVSVGIRMLTVSPVSHAALYLGNDQIAEAVGSGVRLRSTADFVEEESTIVAFRHPGIRPEHAQAIRSFAAAQNGKKYNVVGVVLQAPFTLQRQYCELPLVPGLVRDACIRGLAAVQLGAARRPAQHRPLVTHMHGEHGTVAQAAGAGAQRGGVHRVLAAQVAPTVA